MTTINFRLSSRNCRTRKSENLETCRKSDGSRQYSNQKTNRQRMLSWLLGNGRETSCRMSRNCKLQYEQLEMRSLCAVVAWDGGGGDWDWQNKFNWSSDAVPGAQDDVQISGATVAITSANVTVNSLELSGTLTGNRDLSIAGLFTWTGGTLSGIGKLNADGGMSIRGASIPHFIDGKIINNAGLASWESGYIVAFNSAVINNSGSFEVKSGSDLIYQYSTWGWGGQGGRAVFNNLGVFSKTGDALVDAQDFFTGTSLDLALVNTGTVETRVGALQFQNLGQYTSTSPVPPVYTTVSNGQFISTNGAALYLYSVSLGSTSVVRGDNIGLGDCIMAGRYDVIGSTYAVGTVFSGTVIHMGSLKAGGIVDISPTSGPVSVTSLEFGGGGNLNPEAKLTGSVDLTVSGLFTWTGGTLTGPGALNLIGGMLITGGRSFGGDPHFLIGKTINNAALAEWRAGYVIAYGGSVINNLPQATFDIQSGYDLVYQWTAANWIPQGARATFNNQGLLRKSGDGLTDDLHIFAGTLMDLDLRNTGTVEADIGIIQFNGYRQTAGDTIFKGGAVWTSVMDIQAGSVSGDGAIAARVNNQGLFSPGKPLGILQVFGEYAQQSSGVLDIALGGVTAGQLSNQHDQLDVRGSIILSGALRVSLTNGFTSLTGNQFEIIKNDGSDSITGTFSGLPEGETLNAYGRKFSISYKGFDASTGNSVVLTDVGAANLPPIATISGPADGVRGQTRTFLLGATDSPADQAAGFTFFVNWGDNSGVQTLSPTANNGSGTSADHVYTATGTYTATLTAKDKNGATSIPVTRTIAITSSAIQDDPLAPSQKMLVIGGSMGNDTIRISVNDDHHDSQDDEAQYVTVRINEHDETHLKIRGTFALPVSRIVVYAQAGNDDVKMDDNSTIPAWLYGGDGDDRLKGGAGNDVLLGGAGNDLLAGDDGRDLLIGGTGADRIIGNAGDDILISGTTDFDSIEVALDSIMKEWRRTDSTFAARVNRLKNGGGMNLGYLLTDLTVHDDHVEDILTGCEGNDWFLFNNDGDGGVKDKVTDLATFEATHALDIDWLSV